MKKKHGASETIVLLLVESVQRDLNSKRENLCPKISLNSILFVVTIRTTMKIIHFFLTIRNSVYLLSSWKWNKMMLQSRSEYNLYFLDVGGNEIKGKNSAKILPLLLIELLVKFWHFKERCSSYSFIFSSEKK